MGRDKLSLPIFAGLTVLEQTVLELSSVPFVQRLLVVRTRPAFDAAAYGFEILEIGEDATQGMHRSLKRGLARLSEDAEAAMVCLADQPFVRADDYRDLLDAWDDTLASGRDLLFPARGEVRGNPAVLHRKYFQEIFAEPDSDRGCKYLFERYPEQVRAWECSTNRFFRDLDTPEDYQGCLN